ncbi:sensor domain-containing protein [Desulfonatronum thiodismutans]|uniref:sensor domain-containing protein n=1 Tax=Desulfonatronum thiodismutans TaxID=159290 RepID=UPI001F22C445|nr:bifunctional diguanylate cyclase/phosphodiesterase [Desulfonatronum thiodismutans]
MQLFAGSPNAVALRDLEGRVVACNAAFERMFGPLGSRGAGSEKRWLRDLLRPCPGFEEQAERVWSGDAAFQGVEVCWRAVNGRTVETCASQFSIAMVDGRRFSWCIFVDISDRKQAERMLQDAETKYRSIFVNAVEGIFQTTPDGRYLDVNPSLARIYGFASPQEMIRAFRDIKTQLYVDPLRRDEFVRIMDQDHEVWDFVSEIYKKDGTRIWISENARAVYDDRGNIAYFEGTVVDITRRKLAEEALETQRELFTQLFANSPQAIVLTDMDRNVINANQAFEQLFGFRAEDIRGFSIRGFIVPEELMADTETFRAAVVSGNSMQAETHRRHKDGRLIPVSMIGFPLMVRGAIQGVVFIYQDISERKAFEEQITHQAFHDGLTGLPNRSLFAERLARAVERGKRRTDYHYAVIMVDLDKFKTVNDTLGHQAGDDLLIEVGRRLSGCVRSMDTVARLGGDEFALILEELASEDEALTIVRRIEETLHQPLVLPAGEVRPEASIGVVMHSGEYAQAEDILRDADIAMYRAKELRCGNMLFDRSMRLELQESMNLESELRLAVEKGGLNVHYQPIVRVDGGGLEGFEALVRWNHPSMGQVPPSRFIPLAEETGLILPLGRFVIQEACRQLASWRDELPGGAELSMSVNVSCLQFLRDNIVEYVAGVLRDLDLNPEVLKLEITESVLMHDPAHTARELQRLKDLGVRIAIDDFGTGYSSLSYLQQLPIDHLKIDRSFISGTEQAEGNLHIVNSIISLARALGISVVAEGVEREEQLTSLRDLRCDNAQGFMFSRPLDAEGAAEYILRCSGRTGK